MSGLLWSRPTNVRKQVQLISNYLTTILDGGGAGYVVVAAQDMWWVAGLNENKANSAHQLKQELGLG
jgi:hypothetical protein